MTTLGKVFYDVHDLSGESTRTYNDNTLRHVF